MVYATSRDEDKRKQAMALGAADAFDSEADWPVQVDVVVESVGPATWDRSVRALRPGGRLVVCGGTSGPTVELNLPRLFFKQIEIIGSTMGSYPEFADVTRLVGQGLPSRRRGVRPRRTTRSALERLRQGRSLGKIVLRPEAMPRRALDVDDWARRDSCGQLASAPPPPVALTPTRHVTGWTAHGTALSDAKAPGRRGRPTAERLIDLSRQIHAHPELNYEERYAHDLLTRLLEDEGSPSPARPRHRRPRSRRTRLDRADRSPSCASTTPCPASATPAATTSSPPPGWAPAWRRPPWPTSWAAGWP